jgi:MoxR-like ATPase
VTTSTSRPAAKKKVIVRKKSASDTDAHEFSAYVPDPEVAAGYVGRKIHGVWDAVLLDSASENGENVLLMGDTGAGKTLFGEAYASKHRLPYYSLPCDVSIDPSALFGRMQPTDEVGKFEWQDGPVTEIFRGPCGLSEKCKDPKCRAGVLNISEINFMPPKIAASLYPALDGRRYLPLLGHQGEIVRAHKGLLITADMNPNYRGTVEMNAAFLNRFEHKITWNYSADVEEKLIKFPTVRKFAEDLRQMFGDAIMTPVSTNMLMEFEKFVMREDLGPEYAIGNFASAFRSDEVQAVTRVVELQKENIERDHAHYVKELKKKKNSKAGDDEELEEVEVEFSEED